MGLSAFMSNLQGFFFKDFKISHIPEILKELYIDKVYAKFVEGRTDMTVVDLGANIGLVSYYFYPFSKKIYAVEPSKDNFEALNKMVETNGMGDKIKPIKVAISHESGVRKFYTDPMNSTSNTLSNELGKLNLGLEEDVTCMTIDELFKQENINSVDLLKLDIEGSEGEVIGHKGFEEVAPKIKALVGEYHQWSNMNPDLLLTTLKDYGFDVKWVPYSDASLFIGVRK